MKCGFIWMGNCWKQWIQNHLFIGSIPANMMMVNERCTLKARSLSGTILESNHISKEFLSSDQAWGETQQIIGPLLIGTAVLSLLGVGIPLLVNRNKVFVLGKYGPAGGVVCTRCELPFSRSVFSPNLLAGKLVRCPHCGKISILPRASSARLQEAESRYTRKDEPGMIHPGKEDLQKQIDESRFED